MKQKLHDNAAETFQQEMAIATEKLVLWTVYLTEVKEQFSLSLMSGVNLQQDAGSESSGVRLFGTCICSQGLLCWCGGNLGGSDGYGEDIFGENLSIPWNREMLSW